MNAKYKKILAVAGGLFVCAALVWAISAQFGRTAGKGASPSESAGLEDIAAEPAAVSAAQIDTSAPAAADTASPIPDQTDKAQQVIQADPVKPTATPNFTPTQAQLDSGEVPGSTDEASVVTPAAVQPSTPSGGGAGQVYVPGFGWVKDGGENHGGVAEDMYENGNKVGSMD